MIFEYQLNEDDFVDAQRMHMRKALGRVSRAAFVLFGIIIVSAIVVTIYWFTRGSSEVGHQLQPFVLFVTVGVLVILYIWSGIPYRRHFRKIRALQTPMKFAVNEDEVLASSARGEGKIAWTAFEDWRESKKNFLLYSQPNLFHVVPKRVMQSHQISVFRDLLKNRIHKSN